MYDVNLDNADCCASKVGLFFGGQGSSGYSEYAYLGGPFLVMTYDNDGYGT